MTLVIIPTVARGTLVSREDFVRAVRATWGADAAVLDVEDRHRLHDLVAVVAPPGGRPWQILHDRHGETLSTDAVERAGEFAAWAVGVYPPDLPGELWLVNQEHGGHSVLRAGITPDEVAAGWRAA